jgi:hypothetical protein
MMMMISGRVLNMREEEGCHTIRTEDHLLQSTGPATHTTFEDGAPTGGAERGDGMALVHWLGQVIDAEILALLSETNGRTSDEQVFYQHKGQNVRHHHEM